jgi:hypothetical protein
MFGGELGDIFHGDGWKGWSVASFSFNLDACLAWEGTIPFANILLACSQASRAILMVTAG